MKDKAGTFFGIVGIIFVIGTILGINDLIDAIKLLNAIDEKVPTEVWWNVLERLCLTICFFVLAFTYGNNEVENKDDVDEVSDEENAEAGDYFALEEEGETGEEVEEYDNYYGTESNPEEEDENILKSDEKENN
jgi:hypothetical protein